MKQVTISEPSRFRVQGNVHVDRDGLPFYTFHKRGSWFFTLPPGTYQLSGGTLVGRSNTPEHPALPLPKYPLPDKVVLRFSPNEHKCSINLRRGVITCDPSLQDEPRFVLVFVLLHEIGHYFFDDEAACDAYAAEEMLARGYNPSQINLATNMTLCDPVRRNLNTQRTLRM